MYELFVRNWYKYDENYKLVPDYDAPESFLGFAYSQESARNKCKAWNDENEAGELSRKAEFRSK